MAKNGFKIIDSDMHIMEPPDLWERYIDKKFKARAPRGVVSHNVRDLRMVYPDGRDWARQSPRESDVASGRNFEKNQGIYRRDAERGWTSEVQIEAMDIEGLDIAVLYPTRGLRALVVEDMDAPFAAAMARAYNDWLYDFCKQDPQRLIGAAMLSTYDINDAVNEARRCAEELGFRAVFLRAVPLVDHQWQDDYYEPLWSALEDLNLSVGLHESTNTGAQTGRPPPRTQSHVAPRLRPAFRADDGTGRVLRRRHLGSPPEIARRFPRSQLRLAAVSALALGRTLGTRRRSVGARSEAKAERLFQSPMRRFHRVRREPATKIVSNSAVAVWFFPPTIRMSTQNIPRR